MRYELFAKKKSFRYQLYYTIPGASLYEIILNQSSALIFSAFNFLGQSLSLKICANTFSMVMSPDLQIVRMCFFLKHIIEISIKIPKYILKCKMLEFFTSKNFCFTESREIINSRVQLKEKMEFINKSFKDKRS